jgi:hypothetical protein
MFMMKINLEFRNNGQTRNKKKPLLAAPNHWKIWQMALILVFVFLTGVSAKAQENSEHVISEDNFELMAKSKQDALANERSRLSDFKARLQRLKEWQEELQGKVSLYESQESVHLNLLLKAKTEREELESALQTNRQATKFFKESLDAFKDNWEEGAVLEQQVEDRMLLVDKQFEEIQKLNLSGIEKQNLVDLNQEFIRVMREEKEIIATYAILYQNILAQLKESITSAEELGQRIKDQLSRQEQGRLFERTFKFHDFLKLPFRSELHEVIGRLTTPFTPTGRKSVWNQLKQDSGTRLVIFLIFLTLILVGQRKFQNTFKDVEQKLPLPKWQYSKLAVQLIRHSFVPVSLAFFFTLCLAFKWALFNFGLTRMFAYLFFLFLFTRWGLDCLKLGPQVSQTPLRNFVVPRLQHLFRMVRLAGIVFIVTDWLAGIRSPLTWLPWLAFIIWLLGWTVVFWRAVPNVIAQGAREGQAVSDPKRIERLKPWSYLVSGGALLFYIAGYYYLARYWITSWIFTAIIILWGWISHQVLLEFRQDHQALEDSRDKTHPLSSVHQIRWALIRIAWLTWYASFSWMIIRVWDRTGYVMQKLVQLFNLTVSIGSLNISLKGVVLAGIIIFLTHLFNHVGQSIIDEKMLAKKRLERG